MTLFKIGNRHDIDSSLPRSLDEIYNLNRGLAKRFRDLFEDRGVPVVPSLGNNDIYRKLPTVTSYGHIDYAETPRSSPWSCFF